MYLDSGILAKFRYRVAMLVTGTPQFPTQDDTGHGDGVDPTAQWQLVSSTTLEGPGLVFSDSDLDPAMSIILMRLRTIFHRQQQTPLSSTDLHDLTCFVLHKLFLLPPFLPPGSQRSLISECLRYAIVLYMLINHGTTYYSLQVVTATAFGKLDAYMGAVADLGHRMDSDLRLWILMVSTVARPGASGHEERVQQVRDAAAEIGLDTWDEALGRLEGVLWMSTRQDSPFRQIWEGIHPTSASAHQSSNQPEVSAA